jgi:hypothetical protein
VALLAVAASAQAGWNNPGADRFSGNVPAAVQDYKDIPLATRDRLQARMERHDYDDRVTITRDSIDGLWGYVYSPRITDMHFGSAGRIIPVAGRSAWPAGLKIEALAYTEGEYTILVPAVCSNVARAVRLPPTPVAIAPIPEYIGGGGGPIGYVPFVLPPLQPPLSAPLVEVYAPLVEVYAPLVEVYAPLVEVYAPLPMLVVPWQPTVPCCGAPWRPPIRPPIPAVPEPASWAMALVGLACIAARKLSRR